MMSASDNSLYERDAYIRVEGHGDEKLDKSYDETILKLSKKYKV